MKTLCGAVLVQVRRPGRGLPKAESALCFLSCSDRSDAVAWIEARGGSLMHEFGWAEQSELAAVDDPLAFVHSPGAGRLGLGAAFSFVFALGVDASATWETWSTGASVEAASALGLTWKTNFTRPLRFVRSRSDAEEFLARHSLPCLPLEARESVDLRERWRAGHLRPSALAIRQPGKPRGKHSGRWTYDWNDLAQAQDVEPADALARLKALRCEHTALFFEAADLPVFLVPRAYLERQPPNWQCDVYWTSYPNPGETAVWDHEGYGPRVSTPRHA